MVAGEETLILTASTAKALVTDCLLVFDLIRYEAVVVLFVSSQFRDGAGQIDMGR